MRKLKLVLAVAFACAFLVGCAAPRAVIDDSWTRKPTKVKVVFTEPIIANLDDLQDDLPDYYNKFSEWYKTELENNLGEQTSGVRYSVQKISSDNIRINPAPLNNENIKVPSVTEMSNSADVYLVLDDIWIGRTTKMSTCSNGMTTYSCPQNYFTAKGIYAYYDVKSGRRVGYGDYEANSGYSFVVSLSDWETIMEKAVRIVLNNTPLAE